MITIKMQKTRAVVFTLKISHQHQHNITRLICSSKHSSEPNYVATKIQKGIRRKCTMAEKLHYNFQEIEDNSPKAVSERKIKPFSEMPGPRGLPLVGTLWDYIKKDGFTFQKMFKVMQMRSKEYGPVYYEKIGHLTSVIVSDPKEYAKVIRIDGKYPHRIEMEPMAYYRKKRRLGLGPVNGQGEEWYRNRTAMSKKMLQPKEVAAYADIMADTADDFVKYLTRSRSSDGRVKQFESAVFKWAMESIGTVLFDERIGCFNDPPNKKAQDYIFHLQQLFQYLQPLMYSAPIYKIITTPKWRKYEGHADALWGLGQYFIDKKVATLNEMARSGKEVAVDVGAEFLTYLLTQKSLSPEEANSLALDLLMGGIETTSNATLWTIYCLAKSEQSQERLRAECFSAMDSGADAKTLAKLPYTRACLKEAFRLYPITFATSRIIARDVELGGYFVPKGTHVQANLFGIGRNPDIFPEPEVYRPERWLRGGDEEHDSVTTSLHWGHGARMCIGRRFAEQNMSIALAKIVTNFNLSHPDVLEPTLNTVMTVDRPVNFFMTPHQRQQRLVDSNSLLTASV